MEISALSSHLGQRLYVTYSIHAFVGTLVDLNDTVAIFDTGNQVYIPAIRSISTNIPKAPTRAIALNLMDLFK